MRIFKSIVAIIAGFLTVAILSIATDMIMEGLGIFPGADHPELYAPWMLAVALLYRSIFAVLGGYVCAKLAPSKAMTHVVILAILGTLGGIAGIIAGWQYGNHWYPILLAVTAFPLVWWGGRLGTKQA